MLCLLAVGQACYVYTPAPLEPSPGTELAFDINDRGVVALSDSIGPGVESISGILRRPPDSAFHIGVVSVGYRRAPRARWSGEPLLLRREYVSGMRERKFSRSRTLLAAAAVAGATLGFALNRGLFTGGDPPRQPPEGGPPGGEQ